MLSFTLEVAYFGKIIPVSSFLAVNNVFKACNSTIQLKQSWHLKKCPYLHIELPDQTIRKKENNPHFFHWAFNHKHQNQFSRSCTSIWFWKTSGPWLWQHRYYLQSTWQANINNLCSKNRPGGHPDKEYEIYRSISSPSVVCCQGIFEETIGEVGILFEYMDAGSLDNLFKTNGSLTEDIIGSIAFQALTGLDHLHARKFVHCDIKPVNILLDKQMNARLQIL